MQYILSDGAWFGLRMRPAFVGLLLWCSYPVNDMRLSLAIANKIEHARTESQNIHKSTPKNVGLEEEICLVLSIYKKNLQIKMH